MTALFSITHGAGQSIFSTLRPSGHHDGPNQRLGTLLYVPGPELIVVVDRAEKVRTLGELIETLDVDGPPRDLEPRRIVIESEVWEVEAPTDQLSIGVELAALRSTRPDGVTGFPLPRTQVFRLATLEAVVTRDTLDRIPLLLHMIANLEDARLVTKPFAVTNERTPVTFSLSRAGCVFTTTTTNRVPAPPAEDTAHTLMIAPRVCAGDDITLDVSLTLARASDARTSTASVSVPNGRYALFGLEQDTERTVEDKVPLLGDLPLLGHAFRTWTRRLSRTRVYIFVRPTILARGGLAASACRGHPARADRAAWLPPIVSERP